MRRILLQCGLVVTLALAASRAKGVPVITDLVAFNGTNGAFSYGGLVQATNGNFYGTTANGGVSNAGTVFVLTPSGALTTLVSLDGSTNASPQAGLVEGRDGNLYGTTSAGGGGYGSVFLMSPTGSLTTLALFDTGGYDPEAGLVQGNDGNFYGTATYGGTYNLGTVFRMTPSGALTNLFSFDGTNGANPYAGLVQGTDGDFYGTALSGGNSNFGTVFRMTSSGLLTNLISFDGTNGANPYAGLVQGNDGNFYGTAFSGGAYNLGTIFKMTASGSLSTLLSFDGTNGANPNAGLVQAADGNLYGASYGTAPSGVLDYYGTVFKLTGSGALSTLVVFDGADGGNPYAGLVQGSDGALHGTTLSGGADGKGVIYRVTEALFFTLEPTNQTDTPGATATFVASAAGGFAPLTFQWLKDLTPLTNGAGVSGATTGTLIISNLTSADQGTYSVIVSNSFGSSLASSNAVMQVIVPNPLVSIASPAPDTQLSNALVMVSGMASDTLPLTAVYYQLNGSVWSLAATINGWTNWSASVTLTPGTNLFSVYCQDTGGNRSLTNSQRLIYTPSALLTVLVQGMGTVSPDLNGQYLLLGNAYTLSATPAPGYVFSNWTGSILSTTLVLTFVMQSNLVLQANFAPGKFVPIKGTYNGLFHPLSGISPANSGLFTLSLTSQGNFTARARFAAGQAIFVGQFSNTVASTKGIPPGGQLATLTLDLQLTGTPGTEQITGALSGFNFTAAISAYLAGKGPQAPPRGEKLYTLALPPGTNAVLSPGGWGALTARLNSRGNLTLAGTLGDGARISQSMLAATNGEFPLFVPLYGGKGMLMGWLGFAGGVTPSPPPPPPPMTERLQIADDTAHGDNIFWIKPPGLSGQRYYPNGFVLVTSVFPLPYTPPPSASNALALTNALLVLQGGDLAGVSITNAIALVRNRAVLNVNPNNLTLTLNPANGTFTGGFTPLGAKEKTTFSGVVLQGPKEAVGLFLGKDQSGAVLLQGE